MRSDQDIILALVRMLPLVDVNQAELERYDVLAAYIKEHGGSLLEASAATGVAVTYQTMVFVLGGCMMNWATGGSVAALALSTGDAFDQHIAADEAPERALIKQVSRVLHALAWAEIGDPDRRRDAGKALLELMLALLPFGIEHFDLAIGVALISRDVLDAFDDPDAKRAQLFAYRLLVAPRRLPFLPDLPPAKFPPPIPPTLDADLLLDLCLQFIEQGVVDDPVDLETTAADMRDDPDSVIHNTVQVMIGEDTRTIRTELLFGRDLIDWAFARDQLGVTDPDIRLRAMLSILYEHREQLEMFRDDDLGHVHEMIYLGVEDEHHERIRLAMKIEEHGDVVRCVVGLGTDEVRGYSGLNQTVATMSDGILSHFRQRVAAAP